VALAAATEVTEVTIEIWVAAMTVVVAAVTVEVMVGDVAIRPQALAMTALGYLVRTAGMDEELAAARFAFAGRVDVTTTVVKVTGVVVVEAVTDATGAVYIRRLLQKGWKTAVKDEGE
jgi:TctA family transporter